VKERKKGRVESRACQLGKTLFGNIQGGCLEGKKKSCDDGGGARHRKSIPIRRDPTVS